MRSCYKKHLLYAIDSIPIAFATITMHPFMS